MSDPENSSGEKKDRAQLFLGVLLGLLCGVPFVVFGIGFFAENVLSTVVLILAVLAVAILITFLVNAYRDTILDKLFKTARIDLSDMVTHLRNAIGNAAAGDVSSAMDDGEEFFRRILARYSWIRVRQWLVATLVSIVVVFVALAGSALLIKQNRLLELQNVAISDQTELLGNQNIAIVEQNKLLEVQTDIVSEQTSQLRQQTLLLLSSGILQVYAAEVASHAQIASQVSTLTSEFPERQEKARASNEEIPWSFLRRVGNASILSSPYPQIVRQSLGETNVEWTGPLSPERGSLLRQIVSWLPQKHQERLSGSTSDFQYADLRGATIKTGHLFSLNLRGSDFSNGDFRTTYFYGCELDNANFDNAYMVAASFRRNVEEDTIAASPATLIGASFRSANLERASFRETNLTGAVFDDASLVSTTFQGSYLEGTSFRGADMSSTDLTGAIVSSENWLVQLSAQNPRPDIDVDKWTLREIYVEWKDLWAQSYKAGRYWQVVQK